MLTHRDLLPPPGARARPDGARTMPWATEQDVLEGLRRLGHEAVAVGLCRSLAPLRAALRRHRPQAVLNLLEEFGDRTERVAEVVAWLVRRDLPVTGCHAPALRRAHHKGRARRALRKAGVPVPHGVAVPRARRLRAALRLPWPRVVKSATRHGSEGLTQASIVTSERAQAAQLRHIQRDVGTDALVEQYVEGRELYVGVLGGRALPPCELQRARGAAGPWIASARTKWDPAYRSAHGMAYEPARRLPAASARRVARVAVAAARALGIEAAARIDLRLAPDGQPWVIEANPNPDLGAWGEFAAGAARHGLPYEALLARLLADARRRSCGRRSGQHRILLRHVRT